MIKVRINETGLAELWDSVLEENGWVILERSNHEWALYENGEHMEEPRPFKVYPNHELGNAINQGRLWT